MDKGIMGPWPVGQIGNTTMRRDSRQWDNRRWDRGTMGPWDNGTLDNGQWARGTMGTGTMDNWTTRQSDDGAMGDRLGYTIFCARRRSPYEIKVFRLKGLVVPFHDIRLTISGHVPV
jgi:hypothetical protein